MDALLLQWRFPCKGSDEKMSVCEFEDECGKRGCDKESLGNERSRLNCVVTLSWPDRTLSWDPRAQDDGAGR
jgi:hypothetical protein